MANEVEETRIRSRAALALGVLDAPYVVFELLRRLYLCGAVGLSEINSVLVKFFLVKIFLVTSFLVGKQGSLCFHVDGFQMPHKMPRLLGRLCLSHLAPLKPVASAFEKTLNRQERRQNISHVTKLTIAVVATWRRGLAPRVCRGERGTPYDLCFPVFQLDLGGGGFCFVIFVLMRTWQSDPGLFLYNWIQDTPP